MHDFVFNQDSHWHQVEGQRFLKFLGGVQKVSTLLQITVLAIVIEPLRWVHRWYMRRASVRRRVAANNKRRPPPICDLIWLGRNPGVRALQSDSCSLSGKGEAATITLEPSRHVLLAESLSLVRGVVACCASWAYVRQVQNNL